MDQIFQLQRQIQDLRQEVNTINQVASQLQRSEANNSSQLQQLQQHESVATQQLQAIQQICNRLNQDVNVISNVAQQVTAQMVNRPFTSGQFGTGVWNQQGTGQYGAYGAGIGTGLYGQSQYGTFGAQFGGNRSDEFQKNQIISQAAANRYGAGFNAPNYATNQYLSNLANQGALGSQSALGFQGNIGGSTFGTSTLGTGFSPTGYTGVNTGNFAIEPAHPVQTSQFGATGFAGSQYTPTYGANQWNATSQLGTGLMGNQSSYGTQNVGRYSNF